MIDDAEVSERCPDLMTIPKTALLLDRAAAILEKRVSTSREIDWVERFGRASKTLRWTPHIKSSGRNKVEMAHWGRETEMPRGNGDRNGT
jgi:hypothetical protein